MAKTAQAAEDGAQAATAESLGWQLRAALPPMRLHSVSICDAAAEVRWLSEGALGPDEHTLVVEALSTLTSKVQLNHSEQDLQDGRAAMFLAIRAPHGELLGVAMVLVDTKALPGLAARILASPVRGILQRIAILLRPAEAVASAPVAAAPVPTPPDATAPPAPAVPSASSAPSAPSTVPPPRSSAPRALHER
jgi:hypothetical protein